MAHEQYQACIDACNACAAACNHCAAACLAEQNIQPMARCIALDIDCAEICRLAADYMARGSEAVDVICTSCAQLCDLCGEECERHPMDHCKECAVACRRCADECRRMATHAEGASTGLSSGAPAHH
jgi:hypothetical protein